MGCDIHLHAESFDGERWHYLPGCPDPDRNYRLFSVLADVRNEYDLPVICPPKGIPEDISAELKGAEDFNSSIVTIDEDGDELSAWLGDHSYSWLTLEELMAFDWCQKCTLHGLVGLREYYWWDECARKYEESPKEWCSGTNLPVVSENEAKEIIGNLPGNFRDKLKALEKPPLDRTYCRTSWTLPIYKTCRSFWDTFIWLAFMSHGEPQNIRIVFGFDS